MRLDVFGRFFEYVVVSRTTPSPRETIARRCALATLARARHSRRGRRPRLTLARGVARSPTPASFVMRILPALRAYPCARSTSRNTSCFISSSSSSPFHPPHPFTNPTPSPFLTLPPGLASIVKTTGNPHLHVILRGGTGGPNYSAEHIRKVVGEIKERSEKEKDGRFASVMVDCSRESGFDCMWLCSARSAPPYERGRTGSGGEGLHGRSGRRACARSESWLSDGDSQLTLPEGHS